MITAIHYLNGEKDYLFYPLEKNLALETRAIPRTMNLVWESEHERRSVLKLRFDEQEMMNAFSQMMVLEPSEKQSQILLEFGFYENNKR